MSIRRVAKNARWLTAAITLALAVPIAAVQAQEATPQALTFSVLHDFAGIPSPGIYSTSSGLVSDGAGNYYGTTFWGGSGQTCNDDSSSFGCGTVFKLVADGTVTVLHDFTGGDDGRHPNEVTLGPDGNLYGTTYGSSTGSWCEFNCGVLFKLAPDGTETVLHHFDTPSTSGGAPSQQGLTFDSHGNIYGVLTIPGKSASQYCLTFGECGTVFKLTPDGTYITLHTFSSSSVEEGFRPNGGLILDRAGNLYGTTQAGGDLSGGFRSGRGLIFKLAPDGTYTVLHKFAGSPDGLHPLAGLIGDKDGNLYGTTAHGGGGSCLNSRSEGGCGVVFKLAPNGTETVLYTFKGGMDGMHPESSLYRDRGTGALYGTTYGYGLGGGRFGTVFIIKTDGSEQVLHRFDGSDGANPETALVKGQGAQLLGTTSSGGANDSGVIYSLQMTE